MKIEYYNVNNSEVIEEPNDFFILNGSEVWSDNGKTFESQCSVIGFEDCIMECKNISWRIIK